MEAEFSEPSRQHAQQLLICPSNSAGGRKRTCGELLAPLSGNLFWDHSLPLLPHFFIQRKEEERERSVKIFPLANKKNQLVIQDQTLDPLN
jgi:hypothetical protein